MEKKNFKMNSLIVESSKPKRIKNIDEIESNYYIRFMAIDSPGVLSKISGILGQHDISIASVVQKAKSKAKAVPIIMLIHKAIEKNIKKALNQIADLPAIKAEPIAIKIEQEEQL
jgi:homoserine dehydrogenase